MRNLWLTRREVAALTNPGIVARARQIRANEYLPLVSVVASGRTQYVMALDMLLPTYHEALSAAYREIVDNSGYCDAPHPFIEVQRISKN
jgi:hypothetical protein